MTVAIDSEQDFPASPATHPTPESLLIERSGVKAVQYAIEQPPVIFREGMLLCDVEGASYRKIADNTVHPDRNRYVTPRQSPEGNSRDAP